MALLADLHMLLMRAAAGFAVVTAAGGRCRLRTLIAAFMALLACFHVLFVRTTLICHGMSPHVGDLSLARLMARTSRTARPETSSEI